jgi:urea transporter
VKITAFVIAGVLIVIGLLLAAQPPGKAAQFGVRLYLCGGILAFWTIVLSLIV